MPRKVRCVQCGGHVDDVGPLSARKACADCGAGEILRNAAELAAKSGPRYDRWRAAMVEAVAKLYDTPTSPEALTADVAEVETERLTAR